MVLLVLYLHVVAFMLLYAALVSEHLLFKTRLDAATAKKLAIVDGIYGLAAVLTVITGVSLLFGSAGKPVEFYLQNPMFHAKATFFVVAALLSIWPSIRFFKGAQAAKKGAEFVEYPKAIAHLQRAQLVILLVLPFMGLSMARGL
jgi:putative membrane protein